MKNFVRLAIITAAVVLLPEAASAAAVKYSYDAAGRLVRVDYGNGQGYLYSYDANGNLTARSPLSAGQGRRRAVKRSGYLANRGEMRASMRRCFQPFDSRLQIGHSLFESTHAAIELGVRELDHGLCLGEAAPRLLPQLIDFTVQILSQRCHCFGEQFDLRLAPFGHNIEVAASFLDSVIDQLLQFLVVHPRHLTVQLTFPCGVFRSIRAVWRRLCGSCCKSGPSSRQSA